MRKGFYYLFYDRDAARSKEFALQAVAQTQGQVEHCSGFFVLTGGTTLPELLHTGMALEAFWLDAVAEGIALHPLSQMLEERPFRDNIRWGWFCPRKWCCARALCRTTDKITASDGLWPISSMTRGRNEWEGSAPPGHVGWWMG